MADGRAPLVSVVIPAYNCAATLQVLLESLAASRFTDFEVVVVDDGSVDRTVETAERWRARVVRQPVNQGPGAARNRGALEARGDFVVFLDSDTAVFPDTLAEIVRALQEPGQDVVLGLYDKEPLNRGFFPTYYALLKHYAQSATQITHYNVFASHCAAVRRRVFLESGGFRPFPKGMDIENEELGRRLQAGGCNIVFDPRVRVRHHFAGFKKLVYIFVQRTYWWMRIFLVSRRFEQSLTTRSFGVGTVAGALALPAALAAVTLAHGPARLQLLGAAAILLGVFLGAYAGFLGLCRREKGWFFALRAASACWLFTLLVSFGAVAGLAGILTGPKPGPSGAGEAV